MLVAFESPSPRGLPDTCTPKKALYAFPLERFDSGYVPIEIYEKRFKFSSTGCVSFEKTVIHVRNGNNELTILLQKSAFGCEKSFAMLYRLTVAKLLRYAKRITPDPSLAEEAVQDGFIAIWKKSGSYNPNLSAPFTWMRVIVRNKVFGAYRASLCRPVSDCSMGDFQFEGGSESPCAYVERKQFRQQVESVMETFRPAQAQAIALIFFNHFSYSEVAIHMNKPEGTVKTWVRRGIIKIKCQIAKPTWR